LWPLSEQQTDRQENLAEKGLAKEAVVADFRQKTSGNPPVFITSCFSQKVISYHLITYLSPSGYKNT
jgi:hypothetical protein